MVTADIRADHNLLIKKGSLHQGAFFIDSIY